MNTLERIQKVISIDYKISLDEVSLDDSFASLQNQDSSFDSLNRIDFLIQIEDEFEIELPPNIKIVSIKHLIDEIEKRIEK